MLGVALYNFHGEQPGDLSLTEGETLVRAAIRHPPSAPVAAERVTHRW
jgi:hypothetical protein